MPKVEFIYDEDCPNIEGARGNLVKAFTEAKLIPKWTEWDRNSNDSPSYATKYGSPTILIDGQDIANEKPQSGNNCRIYAINGSNSGVPPVGLITTALSGNSRSPRNWKTALAAIPGVGIILLPKLTCAACWPAYAAIMSSMGVGFFNYTEYLFPISIAALVVTLVALGYRANNRRGYGPFYLGLLSSIAAVFGKFYFESNPIFYISISMLIVASFWNSWPNNSDSRACPACES